MAYKMFRTKNWGKLETAFLLTGINSNEKDIEIFHNYKDKFGDKRNYNSVYSKIKRMRGKLNEN